MHVRTYKVFRFARKLNTAPADLEESRPGAPQRVRGRVRVGVGVRVRSGVRSGVGLVWGRVGLGTATVVFCADPHVGSRHT